MGGGTGVRNRGAAIVLCDYQIIEKHFADNARERYVQL